MLSTPLRQMLSTPLIVLMALVGLLLLLACANLAGLFWHARRLASTKWRCAFAWARGALG